MDKELERAIDSVGRESEAKEGTINISGTTVCYHSFDEGRLMTKEEYQRYNFWLRNILDYFATQKPKGS